VRITGAGDLTLSTLVLSDDSTVSGTANLSAGSPDYR